MLHSRVSIAMRSPSHAGSALTPKRLNASTASRECPQPDSSAASATVKEAGIRVTINLIPAQQYAELWNKVPFGVTDWFHRPLGVQTLSLAYRAGVPWNETGYNNPAFDKLLDEAEATLDVEKRREIMAKVEKIMQDDAVMIVPFWRSSFTFMDKKVKGFKMHPSQYIFGNELALEA